jgi:hypothetical protein
MRRLWRVGIRFARRAVKPLLASIPVVQASTSQYKISDKVQRIGIIFDYNTVYKIYLNDIEIIADSFNEKIKKTAIDCKIKEDALYYNLFAENITTINDADRHIQYCTQSIIHINTTEKELNELKKYICSGYIRVDNEVHHTGDLLERLIFRIDSSLAKLNQSKLYATEFLEKIKLKKTSFNN